MQMIFSVKASIDPASMNVIAESMIAENCWDAYVFQHRSGEWMWTKNEANSPISGHVAGVNLFRYWQQFLLWQA